LIVLSLLSIILAVWFSLAMTEPDYNLWLPSYLHQGVWIFLWNASGPSNSGREAPKTIKLVQYQQSALVCCRIFFLALTLLSPLPSLGDTGALYKLSLLGNIPFSLGLSYFVYELLSPNYADWFHRGSVWILSNRVLFFFVQISYSMYLIHGIFVLVCYEYLVMVTDKWTYSFGVFLFHFVVCLALSTVAAILSFIFIEKPFMKLGRHLLESK